MAVASERIHRYAGTPREVGRAAGRAIGPRLGAQIAHYIRERPRNPTALDDDRLHGGALPWLRALPERFQDEMEGLAEGANVALQLVAEWSYVESCAGNGCSALVGRLGGHVWVARNNDMYVPGIWGHATVREIAGRIPSLSFGQAGDVFTATGVNRDRLWLHHQALVVSDRPRPGRSHLPSWVLVTDLLETCAMIGEVEDALTAVDRDDGMLLFAVDGKSDEFAIFECGSSSHVRRPSTGRCLVGTNHACLLAGLDPPLTRCCARRDWRLRPASSGMANLPSDCRRT